MLSRPTHSEHLSSKIVKYLQQISPESYTSWNAIMSKVELYIDLEEYNLAAKNLNQLVLQEELWMKL